MGLLVNVYRAADGRDCTNDGISSAYDQLCVMNVDGPFEPNTDAAPVLLVEGPYNTARLVPAVKNTAGEWEGLDTAWDKWLMYGGNAASTSDSRWSRAIEDMFGAKFDFVKIFDRIER